MFTDLRNRRRSTTIASGAAIILSAAIWVPSAAGQAAADQYVPSLDPGGATAPGGTGGGPTPAGSASPSAESVENDVAKEGASTETPDSPQPASDGASDVDEGGFPAIPFLVALAAVLGVGLVIRLLGPRLRGTGTSGRVR